MEPTEHNLRAWEEAHRRRADAVGATSLPSHVRRALADLRDKRVLNVPCGSGEQAAELAELGATVTAVDPSASLLAAAREQWPTILWIEGRADALPRELRRPRFDLVYCGPGTIDALTDMTAWAGGAASALQSGGDLLLFDVHPVAACIDGLMHWRESYFDSGRARLGRIVTAVAASGLSVRALEEYPTEPGNPRRHDSRIPGAFLLHARRT